MGPKNTKSNTTKTDHSPNPQTIPFRPIVILIFILYANKTGIENYRQHPQPHRFQNMGFTRFEVHQQNA